MKSRHAKYSECHPFKFVNLIGLGYENLKLDKNIHFNGELETYKFLRLHQRACGENETEEIRVKSSMASWIVPWGHPLNTQLLFQMSAKDWESCSSVNYLEVKRNIFIDVTGTFILKVLFSSPSSGWNLLKYAKHKWNIKSLQYRLRKSWEQTCS